jgi:hypothetical protein
MEDNICKCLELQLLKCGQYMKQLLNMNSSGGSDGVNLFDTIHLSKLTAR